MADMYIQFDDIKGDETDEKHKDWIHVVSYEHDLSQALGGASSADGVHAGGKVSHGDFSFVKRLDSASPTLALYCCKGKTIPNAKLELCRAMGEKTTFMIYDFKDCIIASISPSGSSDTGDPIPYESVSIRYGQIEWSYTPTDIKGGGKTGAVVKTGWSTYENKPV